MHASQLNVVTGAFGYVGKHIARRLLSAGERVVTLTGHPDRPDPFGGQVEAMPFHFDNPKLLVESLREAETVFNTYWVRFPRGGVGYDQAVRNSETLIRAAAEAGVRRFVQISITNASENSPFPYFRGKGSVEKAITDAGLSYAIVRPSLVFGAEDVLVNNIAWLLRRFPLFVVPGAGQYKVQPVSVQDVAAIAVSAARQGENLIQDAVGPEVYSFDGLVRLIAKRIGSRAKIIHLDPRLALALSKVIGRLVGDVVLTKDEVGGLMADLLISNGPPTGDAKLSDWLAENARVVGAKYVSELNKHYR